MTAPRSLQDRLLAIMQAGNLTMMDLARWLYRPHPTVRQWCRRGTQLGGAPQDNEQVLDLLTRLEIAIRYKKGFPVPRLRPRDRVIYLAKQKAKALKRRRVAK